jgi:serine/threonine-protein kinase RsbW
MTREELSGCFAVRGRREEIEPVERRILHAMARCGFDPGAVYGVRLALEEVIANAVHHGNAGDTARRIVLRFAADAAAVEIEVEDEGRGFDPGCVPDPTAPENVEIPCGRGIMLMRAYMTEVEFCPPGNRVRMRYLRRAGEQDRCE